MTGAYSAASGFVGEVGGRGTVFGDDGFQNVPSITKLVSWHSIPRSTAAAT